MNASIKTYDEMTYIEKAQDHIDHYRVDLYDMAAVLVALAQAAAAERQAAALERIAAALEAVQGSAFDGEGFSPALMVASPRA